MERICPFLALASDHRTVVDGYDPEHLCHALTPPESLERSRQTQLCLGETHVSCERFLAARSVRLAGLGGLSRPAPDVAFQRTRQTLDPEPAWRNLAPGGRRRPSSRALLVGGVGGAAALTVAVSGIAGVLGNGSNASPSPTLQVESSAAPTTPLDSAAIAVPSPSSEQSAEPTSGASVAQTPFSYVVQSGDTLNLIATRFGTTVDAIRQANGLSSDVINVGQVLIIP